MNSFALKILAIAGMTANHVAAVFSPDMPWQATAILYAFGGMTYPIMAFLLVEGYRHTSSVRRYAMRLGMFAVIAQVPFTLCFGLTLNVLFTLLMGLQILWCWDNVKSKTIFALIFAGDLALSMFCDWALLGPLMVFMFSLLREKGASGIWLALLPSYICTLLPEILYVAHVVPALIGAAQASSLALNSTTGLPLMLSHESFLYLCNIGYALVGFTLAALCLSNYNGHRGRSMKWFFYAYYPLHLLIIWGVHQVLGAL